MTLVFPSATVGAPDIADSGEETLPGPWSVPLGGRPVPVVEFAAPGWTIPRSTPARVPSVPEQLRQVREWTGWSSRRLAALTGSTHPTVEAILEGRTQLNRTPATARRISDLHRLVSRLAVVVQGDRAVLNRVLSEPPGGDRAAAVEVFGSGDLVGAYLAALDVLRPPRSGGMMGSLFPARAGEATVALHDQ